MAQPVVVGAGEHEEGDVGDAEDAVGEGEGERQVAEGLRNAEGDDQQRRHRGEDHQPRRHLLRIDDAGQPGVSDPAPPKHTQHQQPLGHARPGRMVEHQRRALGDRENEDEVEEELQRRHPLALAPGGFQARLVRLGGGGHAAHPCNSGAVASGLTASAATGATRARPGLGAGPKTQSRSSR